MENRGRVAWADLEDSWNEGPTDSLPSRLPVCNDSYQELNTNSDLGLAGFHTSASLNEAGPKDFAFLKGGPQGDALEAPVDAGASVSSPERRRLRLRMSHTTSHGDSEADLTVLDPVSENAELPAESLERAVLGLERVPTDFTFLLQGKVGHDAAQAPEALRGPSPPGALHGAGAQRRRASGSSGDAGQTARPGKPPQKRGRPPALAQAEKRPRGDRSEDGEAGAPCVRIPEGASEAALTEEDWQRRVEKRSISITAGKDTSEYRSYVQARPRITRRPSEPRTPDPRDRSISKRGWDEEVRLWRVALRQWCGLQSQGG